MWEIANLKPAKHVIHMQLVLVVAKFNARQIFPLYGIMYTHTHISIQLLEDATDELTLEELMEEHCEELRDREENGELTGAHTPGDMPTEATAARTAKRGRKKSKSKKKDDQTSPEDGCLPNEEREEKGESEEWVPQRVATDWGHTDDVVTIGNSERYYFFKIPHKVS